MVVEPLSRSLPASARLTDLVARRAVKYAGVSVFFLDERSFAEPEGFWIGGSRQSAFVVQADRPQSSVDLCIRNAPVENRVTIVSGQWREELTLAPGEERHVQVPLAAGQRAALVTATTTVGVPSVGIDARQPRRPFSRRVGPASVAVLPAEPSLRRLKANDAAEVEPLQLQVAVVVLDLVDDVERSIATLGADVVGEVDGAVEIEVEVAAAVALRFPAA